MKGLMKWLFGVFEQALEDIDETAGAVGSFEAGGKKELRNDGGVSKESIKICRNLHSKPLNVILPKMGL